MCPRLEDSNIKKKLKKTVIILPKLNKTKNNHFRKRPVQHFKQFSLTALFVNEINTVNRILGIIKKYNIQILLIDYR